MRKTILVALRDYNAAVRTKGFVIGLLVMPVMVVGSIVVVKLTEDRADTTDRRIAVVDRSGVVAPALVEAAEHRNESEIYDQESGKQVRPAYLLEIVEPDEADIDGQRLHLSDRVRAGELSAFLEIGKDAVHPGDDADAALLTYHSENPLFDNERHWLASPINRRLRNVRVAEADLDEETVDGLIRWLPVQGLGLITVDEDTGEVKDADASKLETIGMPYAMMMLMFVLIMATVNPLVHSVLEEKMQRIAEVLLGSVHPSQLMFGKLLGALGVSATIISFYLIGGLIAARYLDLSHAVPYHVLPWFAVYGISALFMFGALFLAAGSACSDLKESQSVVMPLMMFIILPVFVWFPVMKDPAGAFATWLSFLPTFTPMLMLVRMASPVSIPSWQPWLGLLGVMLATTLSVWAAGRIFRVGILMQGKPPRLTELLRWALRG